MQAGSIIDVQVGRSRSWAAQVRTGLYDGGRGFQDAALVMRNPREQAEQDATWKIDLSRSAIPAGSLRDSQTGVGFASCQVPPQVLPRSPSCQVLRSVWRRLDDARRAAGPPPAPSRQALMSRLLLHARRSSMLPTLDAADSGRC